MLNYFHRILYFKKYMFIVTAICVIIFEFQFIRKKVPFCLIKCVFQIITLKIFNSNAPYFFNIHIVLISCKN